MFISFLLFYSLGDMSCDDSYIHARIAHNMSLYGLPYFDISQSLMMSTSIVWTMILSILYKLPFELSVCLAILNAFIVMMISWLWCVLNNSETVRHYWLAFILTVSSIHIAAIDQMETPLACLALFYALWLIKKERFLLFGLILSLLPFIRPELIIFALILGIYCIYFHIKFKSSIGVYVIFSGVFIASVFCLFGGIIPHSITAKAVVYDIESLQTFMDLLPGREDWTLIFRLLPFLVLLLFKNFSRWTKLTSIYILILWLAYIINGTFVFSWYPCLLHCPLAFLSFSLCLKYRKYIVIVGLLNLPFLFELYLNIAAEYRYSLRSARVQTYLKLSKIFSKITNKNTTLMVAEIGAISKYYSGVILDGVGLASPKALKYHPLKVPEQRFHGSVGAIPKSYFELLEPDLVLGYDLFISDLSTSKKLSKYYALPLPLFSKEWIHKLNKESTFWGSQHLYLFVRKDFNNASSLMNELKKF